MIRTTFVRHQGVYDQGRVFGPRRVAGEEDKDECLACGVVFKYGDHTALVPLGPGSSDEDQEKAASGRFYNSVAVELHWKCATGKEPTPTKGESP